MAATSLLARLGLRVATLGSAANLAIAAPLAEGNVAASAHTDASRIGVYFDRTAAAEKVSFVVMGTNILHVGVSVVSSTVPVSVPLGSAAAPSYTFIGDADTGMYNATDELSFATMGVRRFRTNAAGVIADIPVFVPVGLVGNPTYSFDGDSDTGVYSPAADTYAIVTAGVERIRTWSDGGVQVGGAFGVSLGANSLRVAGLVQFDAAENHTITLVNADTTLDETHGTVLVDASGGTVNITLPDTTAARVNGRVYTVKKVDASANPVNVIRTGAADLIDGNASLTPAITVQWQSRGFQARAADTSWNVL